MARYLPPRRPRRESARARLGARRTARRSSRPSNAYPLRGAGLPRQHARLLRPAQQLPERRARPPHRASRSPSPPSTSRWRGAPGVAVRRRGPARALHRARRVRGGDAARGSLPRRRAPDRAGLPGAARPHLRRARQASSRGDAEPVRAARQILARMLRNLKAIYVQGRGPRRARCGTSSCSLLARPGEPEELRDRGLALRRPRLLRARRAATSRRYLDRAPGTRPRRRRCGPDRRAAPEGGAPQLTGRP